MAFKQLKLHSPELECAASSTQRAADNSQNTLLTKFADSTPTSPQQATENRPACCKTSITEIQPPAYTHTLYAPVSKTGG